MKCTISITQSALGFRIEQKTNNFSFCCAGNIPIPSPWERVILTTQKTPRGCETRNLTILGSFPTQISNCIRQSDMHCHAKHTLYPVVSTAMSCDTSHQGINARILAGETRLIQWNQVIDCRQSIILMNYLCTRGAIYMCM